MSYRYQIQVAASVERMHNGYDLVALRVHDNSIEPKTYPLGEWEQSDAPWESSFSFVSGQACALECPAMWEAAGEDAQTRSIVIASGDTLTLEYDTVDGNYHIAAYAHVVDETIDYWGARQECPRP